MFLTQKPNANGDYFERNFAPSEVFMSNLEGWYLGGVKRLLLLFAWASGTAKRSPMAQPMAKFLINELISHYSR